MEMSSMSQNKRTLTLGFRKLTFKFYLVSTCYGARLEFFRPQLSYSKWVIGISPCMAVRLKKITVRAESLPVIWYLSCSNGIVMVTTCYTTYCHWQTTCLCFWGLWSLNPALPINRGLISAELHLRSLYLGGIYSGLAICLVSWCHSVPRVLHVVKLKWEICSICMSHAGQQCTRLFCCMLNRKMVASHFKFKSESSWDP